MQSIGAVSMCDAQLVHICTALRLRPSVAKHCICECLYFYTHMLCCYIIHAYETVFSDHSLHDLGCLALCRPLDAYLAVFSYTAIIP